MSSDVGHVEVNRTIAYKLYHINGLVEGLNAPENEEDNIRINNTEPPVMVGFNAKILLALTADIPLPEKVPEEVLVKLK
jgi:hypothetical protein